mgnify:CR=1 FL=1
MPVFDHVCLAKCPKMCCQIQAYLLPFVPGFGGVVLSVKVRCSMWFLLGVVAANKSIVRKTVILAFFGIFRGT